MIKGASTAVGVPFVVFKIKCSGKVSRENGNENCINGVFVMRWVVPIRTHTGSPAFYGGYEITIL